MKTIDSIFYGLVLAFIAVGFTSCMMQGDKGVVAEITYSDGTKKIYDIIYHDEFVLHEDGRLVCGEGCGEVVLAEDVTLVVQYTETFRTGISGHATSLHDAFSVLDGEDTKRMVSRARKEAFENEEAKQNRKKEEKQKEQEIESEEVKKSEDDTYEDYY